MASQLFAPFRALGFTSNHVPLVLHTTSTEIFVSTAVGRTYHVYNCSKLKLIFVGTVQEEAVTCLASYGMQVFSSNSNRLKLWNRGKEVQEYVGHSSDIHLLLSFGSHIISVDECNTVKIFEIQTAEIYCEMEFDPSVFRITAVMHPSTFLNKILFGSHQGSMQLWNIKTNQLIFTFKGWNSPVTMVVQAPAVDVVGVGLQDGHLFVHNLKYDEVIMKFQQDWGPVTALSFRTDNTPVMASGSPSGHIALWDLERKRLVSTIYDAHYGTVCGMHFLQSQLLLVSTGTDNSLKIWIFDQPDGSGRLLRSRKGHSAPPTLCRFYGSTGHLILTAGIDRSFRLLSTINDQFSTELSQGSVMKKARAKGVRPEELKLPPVVAFDAEEIRENDWDNVVTCHWGQAVARTWRLQNKCIGKHKLKPQHAPTTSTATIASVSHCGNFVLIGYSSGHAETFNIQSGLHRGCFGSPKAHDGAVRGIAIDAVNQGVVTGSADKTLKFWRFKSKQHVATTALEEAVCQMVYHKESLMLAVALDDFTIHVVDTETKRIVRTFTGHSNRILDMTYSPDSRWLISSSMDMTVRTWDLPRARLLDCFLVESAATSVSMSHIGDFLATTHVDDLGVYLWSNRTMYAAVSLRPLSADYKPELLAMPTTGEQQEVVEDLNPPPVQGAESPDLSQLDFKTTDQVADELITLSELPRSRWHNLIHLETIKHRNKPKEPPKAPKAAPFFLPTVPGVDFQFSKGEESSKEEQVAASKRISLSQLQPKSEFQECLDHCAVLGNYTTLMELLKTMGPSAISAEFHMLGPEGGGELKQLVDMIHFFKFQLESRRDYEMVQAYMQVFLKIHGEAVSKNEDLRKEANALLQVQRETWTKIEDLLNQSLCLVNYIKSATV